jgi:TDG/mug DNA glycosylase family protein
MTRTEKTLPDYLRPGLDIVSIGINPSIHSVEKGFAFARPGNRFWPALNAARLANETLVPGRDAIENMHARHGFGFTDIVKRPTRMASELTREDYAHGARQLLRKLTKHQPRIAWFQGKDAWKMFLEHALQTHRKIDTGLQPETIGNTVVFVTPNPSGANPAANPKALQAHFIALRELRDSLLARG